MTPVPVRPFEAALSMIGAMLVIGFIDNVIALIARDMGLWQFLIVRNAMAIPISLAAGLWVGSRLWPVSWRAVAERSLWITAAMFIYFGALGVMPIQQALAGLFTSPVFVLIFSVAFYRERVGVWRSLAVVLGFVGVLIVLRPEGEGGAGWGTMVAALAGALYAMGALATRRRCAGESALALLMGVLGFQAGMSAVVLGGLWVLGIEGESFITRGWTWQMNGVWGYLVLQAVGSALGVWLIIRAYQLGETSHVAIYEYSIFLFGPLFAYLLLGQTVGLAQVTGIALIVAAGVLISLRSR